MKRYRLEVIGSKYSIKELDADYLSKNNSSYYFKKKMQHEPDITISVYPINVTVILSITDLSKTHDDDYDEDF